MAHTRRELLETRFTLVRRDLNEIIERLTLDLLDWAPAKGMRTVSGQIVEIVGTEMQLVKLLRTGEFISDEDARATIGDCSNLDNLRRSLVECRRETLDYLNTLTESELTEEVSFDGDWFASLMLPTVPRAELFLNIAEHESYHTGQLTSYLWFRGDNPYSW